MLAIEMPAPRLARDEPRPAATPAVAHDLDVVLQPLSRPDLPAIRLDEGMLAIGRNEPPFASCGEDVLAMLSRRHARVFCEGGAAWVADLGSCNGTTVNRVALAGAPCRLRDGDEVGFGGVLAYRVAIAPRAAAPATDAELTLTLTPVARDAGLETLVITRFPYLVSKTDTVFSRYRDAHARQIGYLSRRQAHVFRHGGGLCIEDLGSTNGTFVDGRRLEDGAVPLRDGALLAFGGEHFVYRVGIRHAAGEIAEARERTAAPAHDAAAAAPAAAGNAGHAAVAAPAAGDATAAAAAAGRTTFVVAPTSFLEIFCADPAPEGGATADSAPLQPLAVQERPGGRRRGRRLALVAELAGALSGRDPERAPGRRWRVAALAAVLLGASAVALSLWSAPEHELKERVARGEHAQAARLADRLLAQRPEDVELQALAMEAALKAHVPDWLAKVAARDFDGARAAVDALAALGRRNPELRPLAGELQWLGDLQRLVADRGGPDQPIRLYADEDRIAALIERWNDDTREHQRALARIASHVPQFAAAYAEALRHLRRLQSEATVGLAAIERLKSAIAAEVSRDRPEALEAVLKEAAEKYPGLGGLDAVREELDRYLEIRREARSRPPGRLFARLVQMRFATPPFQEGLRALAATGQLPPAALVQQYEAATSAWKAGDAERSLAALQAMAGGPWADAVAAELARRRAVLAQFAALQSPGAAGDFAERLLAFRTALDPEEDVHFARATQAALEAHKDAVLARAQDAMNRARALWQDYRGQGAIDAALRIETSVGAAFRTRARLLADASRLARQALQLHAQLGAVRPDAWTAIHEEIVTESRQQLNALLELRNVLAPELVKAKLALLGDPSDDARN